MIGQSQDRSADPVRGVPEWLVHLAGLGWRLLAVIGFVVATVYVCVLLATVTAAILISLVFAAAFSPLVLRLRARGWSRGRAAGVVTARVLLVVGATLALIALALVPYIAPLLDRISAAVTALEAALSDLAAPPEVTAVVGTLGHLLVDWLGAQVATVADSLAQAGTVAILSLFTVFFLLMDGDRGWAWLIQAGSDWQRERVTSAGLSALERVGGYLRGLAILAGVNAIRDYVLMVVLGVPLAGPLAVLVFILSFIPYFGSLLATLLIVVVAWSTVGVQAAVVFLAVITALNVIEGNVMMPLVYRRTVDIHPAVALVTILAGGAFGGILGVFVAIPLVAFAQALGSSFIAVIDTGPRGMVMIPGWLDRLAQWSWRLLVAMAVLAVMAIVLRLAPSVVGPLVFSLILAATFLPAVERLTARGWRRGAASIAMTLGGVGVIVLLGLLSIVAMLPQLGGISDKSGDGATAVAAGSDGLLGWLRALVDAYGLGAVAAGVEALAAIGVLAIGLIVSTVLCFYFLKDGPRAWKRLVERVPSGRQTIVSEAGGRAVGVLGGYMIATGVISAFAAATQFAIMFILGIPLALPLGLLALFGGFIPYVGSLVTTLAALLVTIAVGTPTQVLIMVIWTLVFNIVQGNVVAPLVYGRAVNIHPAIVLLAIPAGSAVAGVMGMFLVVPFIGIVAATWRGVLNVFGTDAPDTPSRVGQT